MNELMIFEGNTVDILVENGELLFEVYSTGMALGQVKYNTVNGKTYTQCHKDRLHNNLKNAEITPLVRNGLNYITESQLYDLMLEMKTDKVKPFRKWVTSEVLPTIRKTGGWGQSKLNYNAEQMVRIAQILKEAEQCRIPLLLRVLGLDKSIFNELKPSASPVEKLKYTVKECDADILDIFTEALGGDVVMEILGLEPYELEDDHQDIGANPHYILLGFSFVKQRYMWLHFYSWEDKVVVDLNVHRCRKALFKLAPEAFFRSLFPGVEKQQELYEEVREALIWRAYDVGRYDPEAARERFAFLN